MSNTTKLLFVTPELSLGGTNSSLVSILGILSGNPKYEIKVFPISYAGNFIFSEKSLLIPEQKLLSAYFGNFNKLTGITKYIALLVKPLRRLARVTHFNKLDELLMNKAIRHIRPSFSPDYVIAFQEGLVTHFLGHWDGVNKIAWIHCDYNRYLSADKSEESLYSLFDKIVCVSDYTASVFKNRYPALSSKTISIHNPFDYKRVQLLSCEPISDERFVKSECTIVSIGRIDPVKRFSLIPGIARYLLNKGLSFKWYIMGPTASEEELTKIQNGILEEAVSDNVYLLEGKSNPYPYLRQSDVLVCLSKSEACPMIFNEAKTLGLSIVTSDFGSSVEFISDDSEYEQIVPIERIDVAIYHMCQKSKERSAVTSTAFDKYNDNICSQIVSLFE